MATLPSSFNRAGKTVFVCLVVMAKEFVWVEMNAENFFMFHLKSKLKVEGEVLWSSKLLEVCQVRK